MRIDKFLCDILNITRTEAKKLLAAGRVSVDGNIVKSGSVHIKDEAVLFDGNELSYQEFFYIMVHKPAGYVCANRDSKSKTVFDLLPPDFQRRNLFVCGRLDKDTTGLVLLTNNGPLAHRLLAPKSDIFKEYTVTLRDPLKAGDERKLLQGIVFKDGTHCKPAYYLSIGEKEGILRISEGKFHQVKRMFAALGNEVVALHRNSIHGLTLDKQLKEGQCRYLTDHEIKSLESVE